jgi:glycosyltransferase involved in cell wall biosynthesis
VICVGQITPVKNQLNIIKALNNSQYKVFIIGNPSSNAVKYYNKCKEIAGSNISFIPFVDQYELAQIYKKSKVHVLASWFETTGLVSLEAAYMGCNIVISNKGDQLEYFKNDAFYCTPDNHNSILVAVNKAYISPLSIGKIKRHFS